MDWLGALRARLTGLAGGRVYWGERPQSSALPAIVLVAAGGERTQHLKGMNLAADRVQVDAFGSTHQEASALAEAALAALLPGGTFNGHVFQRADIALPPRGQVERVSNVSVFRASMDLIFHHAEV